MKNRFRTFLSFVTTPRLLRGLFVFRQPSNERNWSADLAVLPDIIFGDEATITIKNIRNFTYRSVTDYTAGYYDRTFPLSHIENVWFLVEPFSLLAAHTMLSFGLRDGTYISLSVEIRKKVGQHFSQLATLFFLRRHELVYVIGDEQDLIKLRTNHRKDRTYLYPLALSSQETQTMFLQMLRRAHHIQEHPEFYNPFTNTCLTNIVDHIDAVRQTPIPLSYKMWIATYADELMYQVGLLDRSLPFEELKAKHHINKRALASALDPDFSRKIR